MNRIEWQMILKDWSFMRGPMLGYLGLGAIAIAMIGLGRNMVFYAGVIILVSIIVIIGIHAVFGSVMSERKNQTLPFMLSLPVTFLQYTRSKILGNLLLFSMSWLALTVATLLVIAGSEHIPNGLIPFAVIVLGELFAAFALLLAIAIVSESEVWAIVVMTICNIGISIFMNAIGSLPAINATMSGPVTVWNITSVGIVAAEAALVAVLIAVTFYLQSRKADYL
ncbi:MAG: ABC-2 transporter permease [Pseudomonadota bacterium]